MKKPGVPAAVFNINGKVLARKSISLSREIRKTESNIRDLLEAYNMRQDGGLSAHPSRASSTYLRHLNLPQSNTLNARIEIRSNTLWSDRAMRFRREQQQGPKGLLASMRRFNWWDRTVAWSRSMWCWGGSPGQLQPVMQEVTQQRFVYNRTTQYVAVRDVSVTEKGMTTYPSLLS